MKALVVDFEPAVRERLRQAFEAAGAVVVEATGAEAALPLVSSLAGDSILAADAPSMAALRASLPAGVLCIVIARTHEMEDALGALGAGAFDALPRPLDAETCSLAAWRACDYQRARHEATRLEAELIERRARLAADAEMLAQDMADAPAAEHAAAERSERIASVLGARITALPARLDEAAALLDELTTSAAVTDAAFAARQAIRLVEDLIDSDRAARGQLRASLRRVDARAFASEVLAEVARIAADYDAAIELSCPDAPGMCETDPELAGRALHNMLDTALRRARRGRVRFTVTATPDCIRFTVSDGAAAPPERVLATLFDRKNRLEAGTIQRGAALGFCRAAADAIGARLDAEVPAGGGLRLTLSVPRPAAAAADAEVLSPRDQKVA